MAKRYKKRKDGRYATNITVGRDYVSGNPIIVKVYGSTIEELENNKAIIKADYLRGNNIITKKVIFHDYAFQWLHAKKPFLANKTYDMYASILKLHIVPINDQDMKTISKFNIQNLINSKLDKPRTCKKVHVTLNQIFESAIQDNIINRNPCKGVKLPKYKVKEKRPLTSIEDITSELASFTNREKAYILLIKWCGLRKEEALALTTNDIDLDNCTVNINKAVEFINNKPYKKEPKSDAGYRSIPLVNKCVLFFKYYLSNLNPGAYLFTTLRTGEWITEQSFKKMWESIIKKMQECATANNYGIISGLTSHVFRHNYATMLYESGVSIKESQYLLGHSSINVTMDIYTHLDSERIKSPELLQKYIDQKAIRNE